MQNRTPWPLSDAERSRRLAAAIAPVHALGATIRWLGSHIVDIDSRSSGERAGMVALSVVPGTANLWGWLFKQAMRSDRRYFLSIDEFGRFTRRPH